MEENQKKKFILWNNKDITIDDQKMLFWKSWFRTSEIYFVQDLLKVKMATYYHFKRFNEKFRMNVNYLHYFQIISAIPSLLKQTALQIPVSSRKCLLSRLPICFYLNPKTMALPHL